MDPSIRPVQENPIPRPHEVRRRTESDAQPFDLEEQLGREKADAEPEPESDEAPEEHLEAPVSPRLDDEAGGRVDLTA